MRRAGPARGDFAGVWQGGPVESAGILAASPIHCEETAMSNPLPAAPAAASGLSHLEARRIQAPIAACLIQGFAAALGRERALAIAAEAIREDALRAGRVLAAQAGDGGLARLAQMVREVWAADGALGGLLQVFFVAAVFFRLLGASVTQPLRSRRS